MSELGSLAMWIRHLEEPFQGNSRQTAIRYGIEPSYWYRLRVGEKVHPSDETLKKLGLRLVTTLYEKDE